MAIDIAYSIEINDYLDPDRAYEYYWSDIIKDKKGFMCPGDNCSAQITCANLDEDRQNMRMVPHYRVYGDHSTECEIFNEKPLNIQYEEGVSIIEEKQSIDKSIVDIFCLKRPSSYYDEPKINNKSDLSPRKKPLFLKKAPNTTLSELGSVGTVYSVRTLVSRYIRYIKDGSIDNRRVNIAGKDTPYKSIFECIWEQDINDLPKHPAIYYGWAFINRLPSDSGYQIKFKKSLMLGKDEYTATIMIADSLIEDYKIKKLVTTRLEKIHSAEQPTAFVFIYSQPTLNLSRSDKRYANFTLDNLDMIDINSESPLPPRQVK